MDLRTELKIKPFTRQLDLREPVFLVGSCFTEHIGAQLAAHKFGTCQNPHGILFNPVSVADALEAYAEPKTYTEADLFYHNELYGSWRHHGRFSHTNPNAALLMMNGETNAAHHFLKQSVWAIVTLGSAWAYQLRPGAPGFVHSEAVANCHKVPAQHFNHYLLSYQQVGTHVQRIIELLRSMQPGIRVIFTVSPVRHAREGLAENNRSKGLLLNAVHEAAAAHDGVYYFPAYELVIDDLRDYRFYADDLVHPNYQATRYVWQKFAEACINEASQKLMKEIADIRTAFHHRPLHATTTHHRRFMEAYYQKTQALATTHPYLDFSTELERFSQQE
jgi:hypothetical protein